jgi:anti-sigma factor RsiW
MRCRDARAILEPYLAGEVPSFHARTLQRHLDVCAACRKEMEGTQRLVAGLRSSFQVAISPRSLPLPNLAIQPQRLLWFPKAASIIILGALLLGLIVAPSLHSYWDETTMAVLHTPPAPLHQSPSREAAETINRHGTDWRISIN